MQGIFVVLEVLTQVYWDELTFLPTWNGFLLEMRSRGVKIQGVNWIATVLFLLLQMLHPTVEQINGYNGL